MSAVNETLIRDVVAEVLGKPGGTATATVMGVILNFKNPKLEWERIVL